MYKDLIPTNVRLEDSILSLEGGDKRLFLDRAITWSESEVIPVGPLGSSGSSRLLLREVSRAARCHVRRGLAK
jgi:hypothetical protein